MADSLRDTDKPDLEEVRARLLVLNMMIDTMFEDAEERKAMNGAPLLNILCTPIERRVIWNQLLELEAILAAA